MKNNTIIVGAVLLVALGVAYWYYKANDPNAKLELEPVTPEDKENLKKIEIV